MSVRDDKSKGLGVIVDRLARARLLFFAPAFSPGLLSEMKRGRECFSTPLGVPLSRPSGR